MTILGHLKSYNIILGSGSPRRKELLQNMGLDFSIKKSDIPEIVPPEIPIAAHAKYLSQLKAEALSRSCGPTDLIITADTTVLVDDQVLNKPGDLDEAKNMVFTLSGRTHQVVTGVCITIPGIYQKATDDVTNVELDLMTTEEIEWYVNNHEVLDKAGGYGIQDWIGLSKVTHIDGSYYTIMGLPTHKLYQLLSEVPQIEAL